MRAELSVNPSLVVIDTQSLLDWQLFRNPYCTRWLPSLESGAWRWIATSRMRHELCHVLERPWAQAQGVEPVAVLAFFDFYAQVLETPAVPLTGRWPRCSDPDDQKFIDLALSTGARWLISRDRAVLKLRKRCKAITGIDVIPPEEWTAPSLNIA